MVTNVHTKLNNNGLYMMKMIQAKTTVSLRNPGEYIIEIRDITTDCSGDDFAYRVLVRPQIPHLGQDQRRRGCSEPRTQAATKPLNVTVEREENFDGRSRSPLKAFRRACQLVPRSQTPKRSRSLSMAERWSATRLRLKRLFCCWSHLRTCPDDCAGQHADSCTAVCEWLRSAILFPSKNSR